MRRHDDHNNKNTKNTNNTDHKYVYLMGKVYCSTCNNKHEKPKFYTGNKYFKSDDRPQKPMGMKLERRDSFTILF